eukprot:3968425-Prymnesium_polylepis.2
MVGIGAFVGPRTRPDPDIAAGRWGTMKSETMPMLPALKQPDGKVMVETEDLMKHFATMGGKLVVRHPAHTQPLSRTRSSQTCGQNTREPHTHPT